MDDAQVVANSIALVAGAVAGIGTGVLLVKAATFMWKSVLRRMVD